MHSNERGGGGGDCSAHDNSHTKLEMKNKNEKNLQNKCKQKIIRQKTNGKRSLK